MRLLPRGVRPRAASWVAVLLLFLTAGAARAGEFYYVTLFGAQRTPNNPDFSHTFATFVRASGDGPDSKAYLVEDCFTLSWLPATGIIRILALRPETGRNFTLEETLDVAIARGERVSMWGPYRIDERLYYDAVRRYSELEGGEVLYKAIDSGYPTDRVINCIHAVSTALGGARPRVLSPGYGDTASRIVLWKFRRDLIDRDATQEWVYVYLGLENYPILRRDFGRGPRNGLWGLLKNLLDSGP